MSYRAYHPFFTRKTTISEKDSFIRPFFTLFILSRASDNTTSLNIGGTNAWASPTSNFLGDRPPQFPAPAYNGDWLIASLVEDQSFTLPLRLSCLVSCFYPYTF